jgi:hypothetical protein
MPTKHDGKKNLGTTAVKFKGAKPAGGEKLSGTPGGGTENLGTKTQMHENNRGGSVPGNVKAPYCPDSVAKHDGLSAKRGK